MDELFGDFVPDKNGFDLMTFSRDLVAEKYLHDILQLVMTVATNVAPIDVCFLWLREGGDGSAGKLRLNAWHGMGPEMPMSFPTDRCERKAREVMERNEALSDSNFVFATLLGLPLRSADGVSIGAMLCFSHQPHRFTTQEIERLSVLASHAAAAILDTELLVKIRVAQEELETQALMEKARKFLMARQGIGEAEATARLHHCSTGAITSPRRVAEAILLSDIG